MVLETQQELPPLHRALTEIREIDLKVSELSAQVDKLKERREHLEKLAVEEMTTQRLDGVKVAGRSWRIEHDHFLSVNEDNRKAVLEIAKAEGWDAAVTTINTLRLKSLLREKAKAAGRDARRAFSEDTAFAGLVGEYVEPRLRHLTTG